jgi:putative transposase
VIQGFGSRISKSRVCQEMKVGRASLYWKKKDLQLKRLRYLKSSDSEVLVEINIILKIRPSYGHKRVTAMINKKRKNLELPRFNRKRIYRVMELHGLLLKKEIVLRDHQKTGKIITLHSNTRWCSDGLEIKCFNGEKVYVAFALDCHDREALSYVASKSPLLATDIQDLMIQSVDARFEGGKTLRDIQWLSDRGSIYRALDTKDLARNLGLVSCFTSAYSPQSNGMSEAFVGTLKRDYVYTNDCFDADTVLEMLPGWIKDYNEEAPHSGLGMMSPLEYKEQIKQGA